MRNDFFLKLFESYSTVPYMQLSLKQGAVKLLLSVVKCVPRKQKVTFANHCNASKFSKLSFFSVLIPRLEFSFELSRC